MEITPIQHADIQEIPVQDITGLPKLYSERLKLNCFQASDAAEAYAAITPTLTRFMAWDPPQSTQEFAQVWQNWLK